LALRCGRLRFCGELGGRLRICGALPLGQISLLQSPVDGTLTLQSGPLGQIPLLRDSPGRCRLVSETLSGPISLLQSPVHGTLTLQSGPLGQVPLLQGPLTGAFQLQTRPGENISLILQRGCQSSDTGLFGVPRSPCVRSERLEGSGSSLLLGDEVVALADQISRLRLPRLPSGQFLSQPSAQVSNTGLRLMGRQAMGCGGSVQPGFHRGGVAARVSKRSL
jgi:hypothetical protein